jgi:GNAT superfamily N-acetyltransferase
VIDLVGSPDIIMVWPPGECPDPPPVAGYSVRALPETLDSWWIDLHRQAIPTWGVPDFERWLERYRALALPEGVLVATHDATGEPVGTAGSIVNSKDGIFPESGQLAWVATIPEHRGQGLATWLSALATRRLQREGHRTIFLCTGDDLTAAIQVYLRLGFLPCLYASGQHDRWARICEVIGHPFEPSDWPTPQAYLSG